MWVGALGGLLLLTTVPLAWAMVRALIERDYVAAGLEVLASGLLGHLGLELVALADGDQASSGREP